MTGYETYILYNALKFHFTREKFDFFKYNGKVKTTPEQFENRKDKYHFYKLSRKYTDRDDMIQFLTYNFLEKDGLWVGDLLTDEGHKRYLKHKKILQSLSYTFENDCKKLFGETQNPNDLIKTNGDYPKLLTMALQRDIEIETLCILNAILNFVPMWNEKIQDTIRWPEFRLKVQKFATFLPRDVVKYKMLLKKIIGEKHK
jgi:hypothetical protein